MAMDQHHEYHQERLSRKHARLSDTSKAPDTPVPVGICRDRHGTGNTPSRDIHLVSHRKQPSIRMDMVYRNMHLSGGMRVSLDQRQGSHAAGMLAARICRRNGSCGGQWRQLERFRHRLRPDNGRQRYPLRLLALQPALERPSQRPDTWRIHHLLRSGRNLCGSIFGCPPARCNHIRTADALLTCVMKQPTGPLGRRQTKHRPGHPDPDRLLCRAAYRVLYRQVPA